MKLVFAASPVSKKKQKLVVCSFPDKKFNQKFPKKKKKQNLSYHRMDSCIMVELMFILTVRNHVFIE